MQRVALIMAFLCKAQAYQFPGCQGGGEVFRKFRKLAEDRTAISISHRLSTVKLAEYIYFLQDGRIAEKEP